MLHGDVRPVNEDAESVVVDAVRVEGVVIQPDGSSVLHGDVQPVNEDGTEIVIGPSMTMGRRLSLG